jgi:hypothetical protein
MVRRPDGYVTVLGPILDKAVAMREAVDQRLQHPASDVVTVGTGVAFALVCESGLVAR